MNHHHLLRLLLATGCALTALTACGDAEEESSGGEIRLSINASPSPSEVGAEISLSILGSEGDGPLSPGTVLQVADLNAVSQLAAPLGTFRDATGAESAGVIQTVVQSAGVANLTFRCDAVGATEISVSPASNPAVSGKTTVICEEGPSGDWVISQIAVTNGLLTPGNESVTVTATVTDSDGDPVDEGTRLVLTIDDGDTLGIPNDATSLRGDTNDDGEATFGLVTKTTPGSTTVRVAFADDRFGQPATETINVRDDVVTDTILELGVKRNGQSIANPAEWRVLADGEDALILEVSISPPSGAEVDVAGREITARKSSGPGGLKATEAGAAGNQAIATTNENGRATFFFEGGDQGGGTASLNFSATNPDPAGTGDLVLDATINVVSLGFIEFEAVNPSVLYVKGSGENQSADVSFKILDTNRNPLNGVRVAFSLNNPPAGTNLDVAETSSNENGIVTTTISSGRGTGTVSVGIEAFFGSADPITTSSPAIPIIGARPTRESWNLQCEVLNVGGFIGRQGNQVVVEDQFECTSILKDRFTNPIGVPQQVLFKSEGGNILSLATTTEWDTESSPEEPPDNVGRLSVLYSPAGDPPCDVNPFQEAFGVDDEFEPWIELEGNCSVPFNGCPSLPNSGRCIQNPRDGLATILAFTSGEEEFSDLNGDGVYNEGEPFRDLGEPFIDVNDNNQWDPGERFEDLEQGSQGQYDGPNGVWDANTTIWTTTRVLVTGHAVGAFNPREETVDAYPESNRNYGFIFTGPPEAPIAGQDGNTTFNFPGDVATLSIWWVDSNLNPLNGSADFSVSAGSGSGVTAQESSFLEGDYYGFDVLQNLEFINEATQVSRYTTEVSGWNENIPSGARVYSAILTGCNQQSDGQGNQVNVPTPAVIEFEARYRVADGSGDQITILRTATVNMCTPN